MQTRSLVLFNAVVESKRIPQEGELLESQSGSLKPDSQNSQSEIEVVRPDNKITLKRTGSTFFASSSSSSSSSHPAKRIKTSDADAKEEKETKTTEVKIRNPLYAAVKKHLSEIRLTDKENEKKLAADFFFLLAETLQKPANANMILNHTQLKQRKYSKLPKSPQQAKAHAENKLKKAKDTAKLFLADFVNTALTTSASLGHSRAQAVLLNYRHRHLKLYRSLKERAVKIHPDLREQLSNVHRALKYNQNFEPQMATIDKTFNQDYADMIKAHLQEHDGSYSVLLCNVLEKITDKTDQYFSESQAQAFIQNILPPLDKFFYDFRNELLLSSSLSPRR